MADTIARWGQEGGYFADAASRDAFHDELTHLLVEQKMAFNSPVWFNVGVQAKPQCSACFINSVRDDMYTASFYGLKMLDDLHHNVVLTRSEHGVGPPAVTSH